MAGFLDTLGGWSTVALDTLGDLATISDSISTIVNSGKRPAQLAGAGTQATTTSAGLVSTSSESSTMSNTTWLLIIGALVVAYFLFVK